LPRPAAAKSLIELNRGESRVWDLEIKTRLEIETGAREQEFPSPNFFGETFGDGDAAVEKAEGAAQTEKEEGTEKGHHKR